MMHMYPYNNFNSFNSFKGESSFFQAQSFAFQRQNWNLYNQLVDPFIFNNNFNTVNVFAPTDQNFARHNFQQSHKNTITKKKSNDVYSEFTIPSITSIISQPVISNSASIINFPSPLSTPNNIFPISQIQPIPPRQNSPMEIDFNYNNNINLLNQPSQVQNTTQSSNSLSYFATPDKDTAISLQDIIDGMKVMQEISTELAVHRLGLDNNLLQGVLNDLTTDPNDNPIEWLVQENLKEVSKQIDNYKFKGTLTDKKLGDKRSRQDVDDLIEEHMKGIKKFAHNEILCQEILTESSNLEYQFKNGTSQIENNTSSIVQTTTCHQVSSQEAAPSSSNMFVTQENNFSYDKLPIEETISTRSDTTEQRTFKCNEIGCSKEYNCYSKLKSHKVIHTNDKPLTCNVLGCNKKFRRSGELIKHQLDHLN